MCVCHDLEQKCRVWRVGRAEEVGWCVEPEAEKEIKGEDGHVQDGWMGKNGRWTAFFRILYRQLQSELHP